MTMAIMAPCWACRTTFMSDPDKVVSIRICTECKHPTDMHTETCTGQGEGVRQPLCLDCATKVNQARAQRGEPPIRIDRGAYL